MAGRRKPGETIVIAGMPGKSGDEASSVTIDLPLMCNPSRAFCNLACFLATLCALWCLSLSLSDWLVRFTDSPLQNAGVLVLKVCNFAVAGYLFYLAGVMLVRPTNLRPALIVDKSGLDDRRTGVQLKWSSVTHAIPIYFFNDKFPLTIMLKTDQPDRAEGTVVRRRYALESKSGVSRCVTVGLDRPSHEVMLFILTLVRLAGGSVAPPMVIGRGKIKPPRLIVPQ